LVDRKFLEPDSLASTNILLKSLVMKIKEKSLLGYVAKYMIESLESDHFIRNISELISQTLTLRGADPTAIDKFNILLLETLNELEPKVKERAMFRLKLLYEYRMKLSTHDFVQFEKARFAARDRFDKLVLECGCLSCLCIRYEMIDLIEYFAKLRYQIQGYSALKMDCPSCGEKNSLQIIDL
jgi:hypothetical protein